MTLLNGLDRLLLVIEVVDRVPQTGDHRGPDLPEIRTDASMGGRVG